MTLFGAENSRTWKLNVTDFIVIFRTERNHVNDRTHSSFRISRRPLHGGKLVLTSKLRRKKQLLKCTVELKVLTLKDLMYFMFLAVPSPLLPSRTRRESWTLSLMANKRWSLYRFSRSQLEMLSNSRFRLHYLACLSRHPLPKPCLWMWDDCTLDLRLAPFVTICWISKPRGALRAQRAWN